MSQTCDSTNNAQSTDNLTLITQFFALLMQIDRRMQAKEHSATTMPNQEIVHEA